MAKIIIAIILSYLNLSAGHFLRNHENLMEIFRKTAKSSSLASVETKWITQQLDNFNSSDKRTWQMKYLENMEKWQQGGPIFIYIGGESGIGPWPLAGGLLYDLATETNGAMFATEHRYYGDSQPVNTPPVSNLKYLSSAQALADISNFIKHVKQNTSLSSSKVVVVGGSYAGNLAAWMRLRYPDLVDAALSSSAPVLAKIDFPEYLEQVGKDFEKYAKPDCFKNITEKFNEEKNLIKSSSGIEQIKEKYNICNDSDLSKPDNQALFFAIQTMHYFLTAQYGPVDKIINYCTNNTLQVFSEWCTIVDFDIYFNQYRIYPWSYQICTEFGYFMLIPENKPFAGIPIDIDYYFKQCISMFGSEYDRASIEAAVKKTNEMYGGLNPNVTNVIFFNGDIDPWHRLGVLKDLGESVPARLAPEAFHCNDLYSTDNEAVRKIQEEEKMFIKKWIGVTP